MKHLFFVAVIFSGTTISVKAQTNVNIERLEARAQSKNSPKFIEGIEILPSAVSNTIVTAQENLNDKPVSSSIIRQPNFTGRIELCSPMQFKYATMMDREVESITNIILYNFIDEWWATRYQYGGIDRDGIDCSAFTSKLLSAVYSLTVPRTAKDQFDFCEKIPTGDLLEGDLVFFNTRGGVSHVGLYLGNNYFVHSSVHSGVTISSLSDDYYSKKFISGGRIIVP